ncbi:Nif11 family protein [Corallococcus carmarthensis]|uniref:Nif11 family protein n=1 Tax=Corallococcus carmarthensis TaxID=2316728 RepID=A0A3A8JUC5_9BACT|nr:Nif11 family protein [Corallococcus carmarthensis]NOK18519.1 Nif11 family protein [Corallococcus carmarthensis]RKG99462.1 Nif11 family protein [Corallococcus carmarthensis]
MAKDRVIGFLHDLVGDPKLRKQVTAVAPTPAAWMNVAKQSGYEFSADDLKVVSEEIAQKPLGAEDVVTELLATMTVKPSGGDGAQGDIAFSPQGIARLKSVMQQGRYSGYYRPW